VAHRRVRRFVLRIPKMKNCYISASLQLAQSSLFWGNKSGSVTKTTQAAGLKEFKGRNLPHASAHPDIFQARTEYS